MHAAEWVADHKNRFNPVVICDEIAAGLSKARDYIMSKQNVQHLGDLSVPVVNTLSDR
jgi:hypothetical protein